MRIRRQAVPAAGKPAEPRRSRALSRRNVLAFAPSLLVASGAARAWAATGAVSHWRLRMPHTAFGPLDLLVEMRRTGDESFTVVSSSGAIDLVRRLPGAAAPPTDIADGLWAFAFTREGGGWRGVSLASRKGDEARITRLDPEAIEGEIAKGWFRGSFSAAPALGRAARLRDYPAAAAGLREVVAARLFDPHLARGPEFGRFLSRLDAVAARARDDLDLCLAARWAWDGRPAASHFELRRSDVSAADLAARFETMNAGGRGAELRFEDDVAILRVSTMMGGDTLQQIEAAWRTVAERRPQALIIDLRGNPGGAFAIKPLTAPLLTAPLDAGVFASRLWRRDHSEAPGRAAMMAAPAIEGTSLIAFWRTVQAQPLTRVRIDPEPIGFEGRVDVLVDGRTASAAEMAADALRRTGRVRLVGEPTAGQMLSGAYFDLPEGFQVYLPVADYFAGGDRRLEGAGVIPDVRAASGDALEVAKGAA
ncbi:S41 family peptidase [Phenylobacterium sp.]|uniref:S41 family peptidase n=1 Tax=Phenylobacterium sp. TaxID=1871053 RepID=UPI0025E9E921|nr:S41 family peptidase [Phenylobacterium sp.]